MNMSALLSSRDVARFVARGFLRFDALLSREQCDALIAEVETGRHALGCHYGMPLAGAWSGSGPLHDIFAGERLHGVLTSLLGKDPVYDHHHPHITEPNQRVGDDLHQDAVTDPRPFSFDLQLSIFPRETTREMGGTLIVPGSHMRRVNERDIQRYQHIMGQEQIVCPAGTVVVLHHNLWHSARSNRSGERRLMFKLRLQPRKPAFRTWDTSDLDDPEIDQILGRPEPWHGVEGRAEIMNRYRLFHHLSGRVPGAEAPHFAHYLRLA
jgi:hypothetical protein